MAKPTVRLKIDVKKISKPHLYTGKKGTYLDCALFENANGRDEYGQDGFITQEVSKEAREAGEKGPIIGNWKRLDEPKPQIPVKAPARPAPKPAPDPDLDAADDNSIPF